jgi:hypothetical protein
MNNVIRDAATRKHPPSRGEDRPSAVGEGAMAVRLIQQYLARIDGDLASTRVTPKERTAEPVNPAAIRTRPLAG